MEVKALIVAEERQLKSNKKLYPQSYGVALGNYVAEQANYY